MVAKILIVEDEAALSDLLSYNLGKEGYDVAICTDGEDAVVMVEEETPDLVLLDWMLPNVSGIEICRQLRARVETRDIPVIMLTARGEEEDRVRGLDLGYFAPDQTNGCWRCGDVSRYFPRTGHVSCPSWPAGSEAGANRISLVGCFDETAGSRLFTRAALGPSLGPRCVRRA